MFINLKKLIQIVIGFFSIILLDILWLYFTDDIYVAAYEPLKAEFNSTLTPNLVIASLTMYLLGSLAITFFVLPHIDRHTDYTISFFWGGFLGLIIVGVYNLTNYVIFAEWPLRIAVMDICWGFLVFGLSTIIVRAVGGLLFRFFERRP